ncbi:hypothetical protein N7508_008338 [Penicillium antarcticum]|uniref:uncharacterized protein n=1 Tax=Penicillium antarcticum TaxID=416450 RepID=UPI00238ED964|nr:uncharacterized protein N7508_008338 [Penicillium antarcticum]KAJ5298089.1 hypothetical protein N7508_008338 [Penicillium antarcticum]
MWAISVSWILEPMALRMGLSKGNARRFAEQTWTGIYYSSMWTLGMSVWMQSNYWMNLRELWTTFPTKELGGNLKLYLLISLAFWFNQIIVVNVEKRRYDYALYMAHHIVTATVMWSAYVYSAHELSHLVSNLMEAADVFLCIAKVLRYVDWRTSGNVALGTFAAVWFVSRHIIYVRLCWILFHDIPSTKPYGCYSGFDRKPSHTVIPEVSWGSLGRPFIDASSLVCITPFVKWAFLSTLLAFQAMSIIWFQMIVKTIMRALSKGYSDDIRSDDEGETDEAEGKK